MASEVVDTPLRHLERVVAGIGETGARNDAAMGRPIDGMAAGARARAVTFAVRGLSARDLCDGLAVAYNGPGMIMGRPARTAHVRQRICEQSMALCCTDETTVNATKPGPPKSPERAGKARAAVWHGSRRGAGPAAHRDSPAGGEVAA